MDMEQAFWRFVAERQRIFEKRRKGEPPAWTGDIILASHRFCNVYRAADRVSQYLIRDVIYAPDASELPQERIFRALLFRIFNLPSTYAYLKQRLGEHPSLVNWHEDDYGDLLTEAGMRGHIWNNAYMMCGVPVFGKRKGAEKHRTWLALLNQMITDYLPHTLAIAPNTRSVYGRLHTYPLVSDFLSMQYATDIGYALPTLDEDSFIIPGPGAVRGAQKVVSSMGNATASLSFVPVLITHLCQEQDDQLPEDFVFLGGKRRLSLMDIQNCLCEFDKYARVAYPTVGGGPSRIKQSYRHGNASTYGPVRYTFPPHWELPEVW